MDTVERFQPDDAYWRVPVTEFVASGPLPDGPVFDDEERLRRAWQLTGDTLARWANLPAEEREVHFRNAERLGDEVRRDAEAKIAEMRAQRIDTSGYMVKPAAHRVNESLIRKLGRTVGLLK